ncbi:MAG: hypothetical protein N4A33_09405 [Bacteriovoracaceae bacterium]|jgi:hypothetical protein|nr:hypothetical protein [Bacteriovoracaceae bacterium]
MKKLNFVLSTAVLFSSSLFAQENYKYACNPAIKRVFVQNQNSSRKAKAIFSIDSKTSMLVASKGVSQTYFNKETGVYEFQVEATGAKPRIKVEKDTSGRILRIVQLSESVSSDKEKDLDKVVKEVSMRYFASTCLPYKIHDVDTTGNAVVVAEIESCKNLNDLKRDSKKAIKSATKCINHLEQVQGQTQAVLEKYIAELNIDKSNFFKSYDQSESEYLLTAKSMYSGIQKLKKVIKEKQDSMDTEDELNANFDKLVTICRDSFGSKVLNSDVGYKKDTSGMKTLKANRAPRVQSSFLKLRKSKASEK